MQFEIVPPNQDGVILVRVWGKSDVEKGGQARTVTAKLVEKHNCKRILLDFRELHVAVPLHKFIQYFNELAHTYPPDTRIALVISEQTVDDPASDMELARVVSRASGIALSDFRDMDKARDWLKR